MNITQKEYNRVSQTKWREQNRDLDRQKVLKNYHRLADLINYIKSKRGCAICQMHDPDCLEFHHVDPDSKEFNLSNKGFKKWNEIYTEMTKCVILCANCHNKFHKQYGYKKFKISIPEQEKLFNYELKANKCQFCASVCNTKFCDDKCEELFHFTYRKSNKVIRNCIECNKKFYIGQRATCSQKCEAKIRDKNLNALHQLVRPTKINWPNEQELLDLLDQYSFVRVGKLLGVSDNAVRKYCRRIGLDPKTIRRKNTIYDSPRTN